MAQRVLSNRVTRLDIAVILLVFAAAVLLIGLFRGGRGAAAVIEIDGKIYGRYNLSDYQEPREIEITTQYGYNKVLISSGGVKVLEADCPEQTDVKMGLISRSGESIICLPHRLVIYIEGESDYDGVSY